MSLARLEQTCTKKSYPQEKRSPALNVNVSWEHIKVLLKLIFVHYSNYKHLFMLMDIHYNQRLKVNENEQEKGTWDGWLKRTLYKK